MREFKFTTGTSPAEAQLRSADLVEVIKYPILTTGVEGQVDLDSVMPAEVEDPYPVIILINGSAACGKGTLIKLIRQYSTKPVYELSTVDPCRVAARDLMLYQQNYLQELYKDEVPTALMTEHDKGGEYRQLLSDIKKAWTGYHDGPNDYVVGTTIRLISNRRWTIDENTGLPLDLDEESQKTIQTISNDTFSFTHYPDVEMPSIIFINAREPDDIEKLKHRFWEIGLLCITLYVDGLDIPESGGADCDYEVKNYDYDLTIKNKGTVDDLSITAFTLNTFINRANKMYGISTTSPTETEPEETQIQENTNPKEDDGFKANSFPESASDNNRMWVERNNLENDCNP